jgi:hypothetical protein
MAPSERPRARTASTCSLQTSRARGTHAFKISDYISQRDLVVCGVGVGGGRFVQSATFTVGGHNWRIHCYPDGAWRDGNRDYIAVYLELVTRNSVAMVAFDLRLIDQQDTGQSVVLCHVARPTRFTRKDYSWGSTLGAPASAAVARAPTFSCVVAGACQVQVPHRASRYSAVAARADVATARGCGRGGRAAALGRGWGLSHSSGLMGLTGRRVWPCLGSGQHDTRGISAVRGPPPQPGGPTRPGTKVHRAYVVQGRVGPGQIGLGPGRFGHL